MKTNILVSLNAINNCLESGNNEWYDKHMDNITSALLDVLPHGSGIDGDWSFDYTDKRIYVSNSYHRMDENGYYCGWIDFTVIIDGLHRDIWGKLDFTIKGRFGKYQDLKDYLYEIIGESLTSL